MPAIVEETRAAEEEGVKFVFMAAPHRLIGDSKGTVKAIEIVKTTLGEYDTSGRRKPVLTDQISRVECDSVIYAIGETVDLDFCRASGLTLKENGTIEVDRYALTTSRPRFYAGGDLVTGASNVSNAMAYGKQAARHVDQQLMEQDRWSLILPEFDYDHVAPDNPSASRRHEGHHIPANARARSCQEVVAGLSAEEVLDETCRCLRCDIKVADAS
jgi:NADH-quinone oxidoreductase subunit F